MRSNECWKYGVCCFVTALALLAAVGCKPGGDGELGAESPEALFERMKNATEDRDMAEMAACLTSDSRAGWAEERYREVTFWIALATEDLESDMVAGGAGWDEERVTAIRMTTEDLLADYNGLAARYGFPELLAGAEELPQPAEGFFENVDHGVFVADLVRYAASFEDGVRPYIDQDKQKIFKFPPKVTGLVVEGDQVTAKLGEMTVRFVEVNGRWLAEGEFRKGYPRLFG